MKSLKVEIRWTLYHIKKTQKLRKEIAIKYHGHYIMIGCYTGSQNPITFLHVDCGRTFKRELQDFKECKIKCKYEAKKITLQNQRKKRKFQPHINQYNKSKGRKLYTQAFDRLLKEHGYKRLSKYINSQHKILIKHFSNKCSYYKKHHKFYKFWMTPNAFKNGERCPYDRNIYKHHKKRITLSQYNKLLSKKSHGNLKAVKLDWKNLHGYHTVIAKIQCKNCHKIFKRYARDPLHAKVARCPYCDNHNNKMKSQEQFEQDLIKIRGLRYKPGIYEGRDVKIPFLCEKCDKIFYATPNNMLRKDIGRQAQCPRCKANYYGSLGENIVMRLLKAYHINYIYGYYLGKEAFKNNSHDLHVDFYLKDIKYNHYYNNGVAIEFDGYQHFHPVKWSNDETKRTTRCDLSKRQLYDCFTNWYCDNYHVKLIRIPNIIDSKSYYYILKVSYFILKNLLNKFGHISHNELRHICNQCKKTSKPFNKRILNYIINTAPQYAIYKK